MDNADLDYMMLFLLLLCTAFCIQYVPIPYSIEPIDLSNLPFNESFVSKSDNKPFQRIDLPVMESTCDSRVV